MSRGSEVRRPTKKSEYRIVFASRDAERGWNDLLAVQRNAIVDAWDSLTREPLREDERCHSLRGELDTVVRAGVAHRQRQFELVNGARIWFYVEAKTVHLIRVHTRHPNETK
ncbi:hypothetical protein [Homoserinibacter sp. YIM 151385]|uniref:hypothetical protein n=1 Tax=Homoserinibacter sp. YIM 151385 TaxID=2985506 RepID=UPI0022EFF7FF|nr:hypothetical protein [Homoserinibacter sp. YIM 151385]WBU36741.1 hypothetical protein OF852_07265 [Homoserinibacter sp. YIM 151385]